MVTSNMTCATSFQRSLFSLIAVVLGKNNGLRKAIFYNKTKVFKIQLLLHLSMFLFKIWCQPSCFIFLKTVYDLRILKQIDKSIYRIIETPFIVFSIENVYTMIRADFERS